MNVFQYFWNRITLTSDKKKLIDRWNSAVIYGYLYPIFPLLSYWMHRHITYDKIAKVTNVDINGIPGVVWVHRDYQMTDEFMSFYAVIELQQL